MRKLTYVFIIAAVLFLGSGAAYAQQAQASFWLLSGTNLVPVKNTWGLKVPFLANLPCLGTDGSGVFGAGTCTGGGSGAYSFTPATNFSVGVQATSGIPWFQNGLHASSTIELVNLDQRDKTATSTLNSAFQWGSTVRDNLIAITAARTYPAANSTGGLFNLTNTLNDGSALVITSNHAGSATNDLLLVQAASASFNRRLLQLLNAGTGNALIANCTNTVMIADCVDVTSNDTALTAFGVSGSSTAHGIIKVTAFDDDNVYGNASNANASAISIVVNDAAQGIFATANSGVGSSTGNFLTWQNFDNQRVFSVASTGKMGFWDSSPDAMIEIVATTSLPYLLATKTSDGDVFALLNNGNLGIATTSPYSMLSVAGQVVAQNYIATSTFIASTFPYASTTAISASNLVSGNCLQAGTGGLITSVVGACGTGGSTARPDFDFGTLTFSTSTAATTTSIWTQGVFFSSSTVASSQFPYASSSAFTAGNLFATGKVTLPLGSSGAQALVACSGTGIGGPCAAISPGADDAILKSSGGGASWVSGAINLASANAVGASILPVANGGTSFATYTPGNMLYANAVGTLAKIASTTSGTVLALVNGIPTWTATTTFSAPLSYTSGVVSLTTRTDFNFGTLTFSTSTAATTTSIWLNGGSFFSSSTVASQFPYASSTAHSMLYASSTIWQGGGLSTDCNSSNFLQITGGVFGCGTPAGGGSTFGKTFEIDAANWLSATTTGTYGINANATGATYGFGIGDVLVGYASSTNKSTVFGIGAGGSATTSNNANLQNTAIGYDALNSNTTGSTNTALGYFALQKNTTGLNNVALGVSSLANNTVGNSNFGIGTNAASNVVTGTNNVAIGTNALGSGDPSTAVAVGVNALFGNVATDSVAVGYFAGDPGKTVASTRGNVFLGSLSAGKGTSGIATGANWNTFIGYQSGFALTTGAENILIGSEQTASNLTSGIGNIGIGNDTFFPSATGNNQLNIGGLIFGSLPATSTSLLVSTGTVGIASSSPTNMFSIGTTGSVYGSIAVTENPVSTTTSATGITVDWSTGNTHLLQVGTAAYKIGFDKASTTGMVQKIITCNPGAAAGALTWITPSILWAGGTIPTQTTTANKCDVYSCIVTQATSTNASSQKILCTGTANF